MRYERRSISCLLIICLIVSAVYTGKTAVVLAKRNAKISIRLKIGNQIVSRKTISIKKGKRKNIKVTVPKQKKYYITFRSNRPRIVSVSKTGKLMAKKIGTAKVTSLGYIENPEGLAEALGTGNVRVEIWLRASNDALN